MLPLVPVQRRTTPRLKAGRAIVVERTPAAPASAGARVDTPAVSEKRQRADRRQEQRPITNERRQTDRRRGRRGGPDRRLQTLLSNSDAPPSPSTGTRVDTSV